MALSKKKKTKTRKRKYCWFKIMKLETFSFLHGCSLHVATVMLVMILSIDHFIFKFTFIHRGWIQNVYLSIKAYVYCVNVRSQWKLTRNVSGPYKLWEREILQHNHKANDTTRKPSWEVHLAKLNQVCSEFRLTVFCFKYFRVTFYCCYFAQKLFQLITVNFNKTISAFFIP